MRKRKNIIETPKRMRRSLSSTQSQRNSNSFSTFSNRSQDDCKLEYNTKKFFNLCQEQGKCKRTNYWCFSHEIPVCVVNCYDNHRRIHRVSIFRQSFSMIIWQRLINFSVNRVFKQISSIITRTINPRFRECFKIMTE